MGNLCYDFADFVIRTQWEDLPESTVNASKLVLLDSIGCALGGITTDPGKMTIHVAKKMAGPPEATILGVNGKVSENSAVFANGQLINSIDFDSVGGRIHTPPYVIPLALASGESANASGKDLILATAIGYEIAGAAENHFGGVAAACQILNLNQHKIANAFGIAGHLCQIVTINRYDNSEHRAMTKYAVPGWQNTGSWLAVQLAEQGFVGDTTLFDTEPDFWKISNTRKDRIPFGEPRDIDNTEIVKRLGNEWIVTEAGYKRYPCCGCSNTPLGLFYSIIETDNLKPEEIECVKVWGIQHLDYPVFYNRELNHIVDIQFGPAYLFSLAAHHVRIGVEWQDMETVKSPEIIEFSKKVSYQANPDFKENQMVRVEVFARGKQYVLEEKDPLEFVPFLDTTEQEIIAKFRHNAARVLTRDQTEEALDRLLSLESEDDISGLMSLLIP